MTQRTATRKIRDEHARNGKSLPPLPMNKKICLVCRTAMDVADGSVAYYHGCCREFRNHMRNSYQHTKECHA